MKIKSITLILAVLFAGGCSKEKSLTLSDSVLMDKIRGGWAGQIIGCTYGGPTEFKFKGITIPPEYDIPWYDDYIRTTFEKRAGLYDDIYMDICHMETIDKYGLEAPVDTFARAFAHADYKLWHANQIARYQILRGTMPPASGHWINNPHADDIDFQIQADFIGLMCPGMPETAARYSWKLGHIMNDGDGVYGGAYVAALYSLAFVYDDMERIVTEALQAIPAGSRYHRCISNTITLWKKYPDNWLKTWEELETLHGNEDIGCGYGVDHPYNIDAALNSAYVVMGLLYGEGDFFKTMDISTRCGQDSDCNPATACGILGTMLGYDKIGEQWTRGMAQVENDKFPFTESTLLQVYEMSFRHAGEMIRKNGGRIKGSSAEIILQTPTPLPLEQSFSGLYPVERIHIGKEFGQEGITMKFHGTGFIFHGTMKRGKTGKEDYTALFDIYLNGKKMELFDMPCDFIQRRYDIFHKYGLPEDDYTVEIRWKNYEKPYSLLLKDFIYYSDTPRTTATKEADSSGRTRKVQHP